MSFPIDKIRPLNEQEVFDIALRTMRNRDYLKAKSEKDDSCLYRSSVGPCAIGACIPNTLYDYRMEGKSRIGGSIGLVLSKSKFFPELIQLFSKCKDTFLQSIQSCHDNLNDVSNTISARNQFENSMYKVAYNYNLKFTGLNEQYPTDYNPNKDERYQVKCN